MTTQQSEPEQERDRRISIPNIPVRAARWYLPVFTAITVYLTASNTLFVVATERIIGWQAIQYVVTGELLKAGGVALIVSPIITEVGRMVLAELWRERRERKAREEGFEKGHAEGRAEGVTDTHHLWLEWNRRREDAAAQGITFDEPPPELENQQESSR